MPFLWQEFLFYYNSRINKSHIIVRHLVRKAKVVRTRTHVGILLERDKGWFLQNSLWRTKCVQIVYIFEALVPISQMERGGDIIDFYLCNSFSCMLQRCPSMLPFNICATVFAATIWIVWILLNFLLGLQRKIWKQSDCNTMDDEQCYTTTTIRLDTYLHLKYSDGSLSFISIFIFLSWHMFN